MVQTTKESTPGRGRSVSLHHSGHFPSEAPPPHFYRMALSLGSKWRNRRHDHNVVTKLRMLEAI
jgi:hypothetical protein